MRMSKTIISAESDNLNVYMQKIWQHRSLIITLAKRDLKIKYAQTLLGLAWTVVQPLVAVVIYTLFFTLLMDFDTAYPYVLFVLSGILLWGLFNYIFSQGSASLTNNQDLIRKLYFPKIILPLSKTLVGLVEFAIISILFIALLLFYQIGPEWKILLVPFILFTLCLFSVGLAFILSVATIKNRDLNHVIPFLVNFGIWFTPVFYPVSIIPERFENFLYLNPLASLIQLFRVAVFNEPFSVYMLLGIPISFLIFLIGFVAFKRAEDSIVDYI